MIPREKYMSRIRPYIGKPYIKVLTGIRRCGKSSLLQLLMDELKEGGVDEDHIIYINFENLAYEDLAEAQALRKHIKDRMAGDAMYYLLIDEIQEVSGWEKAVNSLMVESRVDIYITGSNSKLLSSELATHIAGRYVTIPVSTLSYKEYLLFRGMDEGMDTQASFWDYLKRGGFPQIAMDLNDYEQDYKTVSDIYSSILIRDTIARHNIRDLELLNRVVRFVFDNIGNTFSAKRVADYFKSQYRSVHIETIYNYLNALEEAFVISRKQRFDIRGKEFLKTNEKYYVGDHALIYGLLGFRQYNVQGILENIVMHELVGRGYDVAVGKLGDKEVDFVAQRKAETIYVQVTYKMDAVAVAEREFAPLLRIRDNFPKYVLSLDEHWEGSYEGIVRMSIPAFLLSGE